MKFIVAQWQFLRISSIFDKLAISSTLDSIRGGMFKRCFFVLGILIKLARSAK